MPEFTQPLFLLLLLGVPLVMYRWQRRPRPALQFSDTRLFVGLPSGRSRLAKLLGGALRALALIALTLALAGPRWPDPRSRIKTQGIAIEMVLDVSGSMAEKDFNWEGQPISRLEAAKRALHLFVAGGDGPDGQQLQGRPEDLIGLVTFATWPESACPLTLSHSVLLGMLDKEQPRTIPTESRTNIGDAIALGLRRLDASPIKKKVLVLLSDGEHNEPPPAHTPRQAAQLAANQGVRVYTIDAGGEGNLENENADPKERARLRESAEEALQAVAQITGGRYFRAPDTHSLIEVYQEIDRLEKQEIQSFQYQRYFEAFSWFALLSLVLLMGVMGLESIWLKIP